MPAHSHSHSLSPDKEHFPRLPFPPNHGSAPRPTTPSHSYSFSGSSSSRITVPIWDSADPDRAPPPLPMHPGTSPKTKPNTSAMIQNTVAQLAQKAEQNSSSSSAYRPENPYAGITLKPTTANNRVHRGSVGPAPGLTSGSTYNVSGAMPAPLSVHSRMKSLEPLGNRENQRSMEHISLGSSPTKEKSELSSFLDQHRQPRSPTKMTSRTSLFDSDPIGGGNSMTPEKSPVRSQLGNTTSTVPPSTSASPIAIPHSDNATPNRPSSRYLNKPILGENTPPSATMLALQNMHVPSDLDRDGIHRTPNTAPGVGNSERYSPLHQSPSHYVPSQAGGESLESVATQIRTLTNIATNLQAELTSLSRRSKDNATDLMSLKDATSMRDEDIRRSLKDLSVALNMRMKDLEPLRYHLTEGIKPPSKEPRRSSRSRDSSPASAETASISLLEKVMREMATKEGMESVLRHVEEVKQKDYVSEGDKNVLKMLEEILSVVKEPGVHRALSNASAGAARRALRSSGTDDIEDLLRQVHQDVLADGNMTGDVKNIVEDMKKEIITLGSTLGQKLSQRRRQRPDEDEEDDEEDDDEPASREEIADIVDTGLNALRRHLEEIIDDSHRRSVQSVVLSPDEIYDTVLRALDEHREMSAGPMGELERGVVAAAGGAGLGAGVGRDEVLRAVRDGLETYRPQVEVQTTGLERDEVLECLEEGLRQHRTSSVDYERIRGVLSDALEGWDGPALQKPDAGIRIEDIERIVREGLENAKVGGDKGISKVDVVGAVGDGIDIAKPSLAREIINGVRTLLEEKRDAQMRIVEREEILATIRDGLARQSRGGTEQMDHQMLSDRIITTIKTTMASLDSSNTTTPRAASSPTFADGANKGELIATIRRAFEEAESSPRDIQINSDDICAAVKEGMDLHMTEQLAVLLEEMKGEFTKGLTQGDGNTAKVLENVGQAMQKVEAQIEGVSEKFTGMAGKEEMLGMLQKELGLLHKDLCRVVNESTAAVDPSGETVRLLEALEKEFEHMRGSLKDMFAREREGTSAKSEILDAIRDVAECEHLKGPTVKHAIEEIKKEVANGQGGAGKEDVAEIVKNVIERTTIEGQAKDEDRMKKMIEEFGKGIDGLKEDMERMGVSEQLEGVLEGLRGEMKAIREKVEENGKSGRGQEMVIAGEVGIAKDLETLKAMLNTVQESIRASGERLHEDAVRKSDLSPIVDAIKDVKGSFAGPDTVKRAQYDEMFSVVKSVQGSLEKKQGAPDNIATREDLDSVESLLHAMKARMEEMMSPEGTLHGLSAERFDSLAAVAQETKAMLESMKSRDLAGEGEQSREPAEKDTIDDVNSIIKDIWVMVEDLKAESEVREAARKDPEQRVFKKDVQAVEALAFEIKTLVEELEIPDPATLPTKVELDALFGLVSKFQEKVESEGELTAQAFEARKIEHGGLAGKIEEAKKLVGEVRGELKDGMVCAGRSVEAVRSLIQGLINASETFATRTTINDLSELMNKEFANIATGQNEARKEASERGELQIQKFDEGQEKLLGDVAAKFDVKFGELAQRYEEARTYLENKFELARKRDVQHLEALTGAKAVTEDLLGLIRDEANSFYERTGKAFSGMGDEMKGHRELVVSEFEKASIAANRLEKQLGESHPEILTAVREVMDAVGKQFDISREAQDSLAKNVQELPTLVVNAMPKIEMPKPYDDTPVRGKLDTVLKQIMQIPPPPEKYDDSVVIGKLESIISHVKMSAAREDDTRLLGKLNEIHASVRSIPEPPKAYDDAPVHGKLDTLLDQATVTGEILLQMDKLDSIQEQVSAAQQELKEVMTTQKAWVANEQENRRKEAEEAAVLLERRKAQREKVEQDIIALHDEKDALLESVRALRKEKDELTCTTGKLGREVSGLETALRIRREEMRVMEERAEVLEKRVVEGVLDHARSLLVERVSSGPEGMNLKRSKRDSGHGSTKNDPVTNSVAMALKRRGPPKASFGGTGKRVLSLNNVNINANRSNERPVSVAPTPRENNPSLKKSQSVKQGLGRNFSLDSRKSALENSHRGMEGTSIFDRDSVAGGSRPGTSGTRLVVHEEEDEHDSPSPNYETPDQTPGRVETPAEPQKKHKDERALVSSQSKEMSPYSPGLHDEADQRMVDIHSADYDNHQGADTRSTISSVERQSFGSSTGLTTAASVRCEHEREFEQDGRRCYPDDDGHGDVEDSYDHYDDSFAPSHHRDDRNRDVSEYSPDASVSGCDDEEDYEDDGRTEVSASQYEHDHDQSASGLQDDSRYTGIDDSQVTSTTGIGDDVSGLSESVLSRP